MPQIGPAEILVVVLVALLVFGPHRLPEVARQVGRGLREVKKLQEAVSSELSAVLHESDSDSDTSSDDGPTLAEASEPAPASTTVGTA